MAKRMAMYGKTYGAVWLFVWHRMAKRIAVYGVLYGFFSFAVSTQTVGFSNYSTQCAISFLLCSFRKLETAGRITSEACNFRTKMLE